MIVVNAPFNTHADCTTLRTSVRTCTCVVTVHNTYVRNIRQMHYHKYINYGVCVHQLYVSDAPLILLVTSSALR